MFPLLPLSPALSREGRGSNVNIKSALQLHGENGFQKE